MRYQAPGAGLLESAPSLTNGNIPDWQGGLQTALRLPGTLEKRNKTSGRCAQAIGDGQIHSTCNETIAGPNKSQGPSLNY